VDLKVLNRRAESFIMASLPSSEVALDFRDSLNDLQINNRYEISNLTIIAKENTEHAQAISQTLENHVRTVGSILASPLQSCDMDEMLLLL